MAGENGSDTDTPDVAADPDATETPGADKVDEGTDLATLEPLKDANTPNLFRRVLSFAGAGLRKSPDADQAVDALPTFSVMYVFEDTNANGESWLQVSTSLRDGLQGLAKAVVRWGKTETPIL